MIQHVSVIQQQFQVVILSLVIFHQCQPLVQPQVHLINHLVIVHYPHPVVHHQLLVVDIELVFPILKMLLDQLYKKDALFTGSTQQLSRASRASIHDSNMYISSITNIPAATAEEKKKDSTIKAFADILGAMTDFSILKNKQMLLICIGNIFSMLGYYLPIMCLVSFAIDDLHVNQTHASFLLTIFGKNRIIIIIHDVIIILRLII